MDTRWAKTRRRVHRDDVPRPSSRPRASHTHLARALSAPGAPVGHPDPSLPTGRRLKRGSWKVGPRHRGSGLRRIPTLRWGQDRRQERRRLERALLAPPGTDRPGPTRGPVPPTWRPPRSVPPGVRPRPPAHSRVHHTCGHTRTRSYTHTRTGWRRVRTNPGERAVDLRRQRRRHGHPPSGSGVGSCPGRSERHTERLHTKTFVKTEGLTVNKTDYHFTQTQSTRVWSTPHPPPPLPLPPLLFSL